MAKVIKDFSEAQKINWQSQESFVLQASTDSFETTKLPDLESHLWFKSSGTASTEKYIALSKDSFLYSAKVVNEHIEATEEDVFACALPFYHVGGFSLLARASILKAKFVEYVDKWSAHQFKKFCENHKATVTSLVPTQVYDLVKENISAPVAMRVVFVGGGHLTDSLYLKARSLGWPLLTTYGMTEMGSQIATASLQSLTKDKYPVLEFLPHIDHRINPEGFLEIKSQGLFTGAYHIANGEFMERQGEWFTTSDKVEIKDNQVFVKGRGFEEIKVSGELVNLSRLTKDFENLLGDNQFLFFPMKNDRLENQVSLLIESKNMQESFQVIKQFNSKRPGFERVRSVYFLDSLEKTSLGKIKVQENLKQIYS